MKFLAIESRTDKSGKTDFVTTAFDSVHAANAKVESRLAEYEGSAIYSRAMCCVIDQDGAVYAHGLVGVA